MTFILALRDEISNLDRILNSNALLIHFLSFKYML